MSVNQNDNDALTCKNAKAFFQGFECAPALLSPEPTRHLARQDFSWAGVWAAATVVATIPLVLIELSRHPVVLQLRSVGDWIGMFALSLLVLVTSFLIVTTCLFRFYPLLRAHLRSKSWRRDLNVLSRQLDARDRRIGSVDGAARAARLSGLLAGPGASFDVREFNAHVREHGSRRPSLIIVRPQDAETSDGAVLESLVMVSGENVSTFETESILQWTQRRVVLAAWFSIAFGFACAGYGAYVDGFGGSGGLIWPVASSVFLAFAYLSARHVLAPALGISDALCRPHEVEFVSPFRSITFDADEDVAIVDHAPGPLTLVFFIKPDRRYRSLQLDRPGLAHLIACWRPRDNPEEKPDEPAAQETD